MQEQVDLMKLASVEIQKTSKEGLTEVSGVGFDLRVPQRLRAAYLLNAMGNPYCFRVGELGVKLEFMDRGPSLQAGFLNFLRRKKSGL